MRRRRRRRERRLQIKTKNIGTKDASAMKENTDAEAPLSRLSDDSRSSSSSIAIPLSSESPSPPSSPGRLPEDKSNEYERSWQPCLSRTTSYNTNSPSSVNIDRRARCAHSSPGSSSEEDVGRSPPVEPELQASYIPRINTRTYRAIDPPRRYQSEVTTVDRKSDVCEDTAAGRFGTLGAAPDPAPSRTIHAIKKFTTLYAKTPADYIQDRNTIKEATAQDINVINNVSLSASSTLVERNGIVVESSSTNSQTSTSQS